MPFARRTLPVERDPCGAERRAASEMAAAAPAASSLTRRLTRCTRPALQAAWLAFLCGAASAGRPLGVDDASVNDAGKGHVETWAARASGATAYHLAPAYAPLADIELGALLARARGGPDTASALQVKWRITPSRQHGCNVGAVLGIGHVDHGGGNTPYINGLLSCNQGSSGSLHLNLGTLRPRGAPAGTTWGVAIERAFGPLTPHLEWFGSPDAKPTLQLGLRGDVVNGVQLDGSIGRSGGQTLVTIGMRFGF